MRIPFEVIKVTGSKRARCPVCGKTTGRSRTFGQSVGPFNRHPDGQVKTRDEIRDELHRQLREWKKDPDGTHDRCRLAAVATGRV